ncbi:hypothetical protein SAMN05216319_0551 [Duganella sp. CF402]|nr:hypothetical protein EV582_3074 [Duganella sp. BK701]SEK87145.1 hypothetical protein SAMN05216319_0551 [Duganella sp. CF402]
MLLLSNGTLFERNAAKQFCEVVDSAGSVPNQLNDRKYLTLQNKINAL